MTREEVLNYINEKYDAQPEKLWKKYPNYIVFRHQRNRKWFAVIMDVPLASLGLSGTKIIDVLDVKLPPAAINELVDEPGYLPAYHMNKTHWITVRLDQVETSEIGKLLEMSYRLTNK